MGCMTVRAVCGGGDSRGRGRRVALTRTTGYTHADDGLHSRGRRATLTQTGTTAAAAALTRTGTTSCTHADGHN